MVEPISVADFICSLSQIAPDRANMTAPATANASNAGAAPSEARGRFRSAVEAAMEAAMLPARLAARVYEAGRGALASVECLTPGKIAGAAWGAAAEGAEVRHAARQAITSV